MNGTPFTVVTTNYIHYPRLTFGYTRSINEKLNLGIDLGYGNKLLSLYEINKDYQLIEFRPKVNYLFGVKKKSYFGLELFHVYNQDVFYNSNYRSSSFKKYSFEKANFKRNKSGLMIKYGHYYTVFKSFGFNFYGGVENSQIPYYQYLDTIYNSSINLALEGKGEFTFRHLEILASCSFMICENSINQLELPLPLKDGKHFVSFKNKEDLIEKINFYLENNVLRNEIALNGRKVLEEHYSPKKHGEFLINKIFS